MVRRAAQKLAHHAVAELQRVRAAQIRNGGHRHHAAHIDGELRCQPQHQLPAGGMPRRHQPLEIQVVALGDARQMFCAVQHVVHRSRPAAARIAEPSVLDAPRSGARFRQRRAQVAGVIEIVLRAPESAVNEEHGRVRTWTARQPQIPELKRILAVRNARVRLGRREPQNILAHQGRGGGKTHERAAGHADHFNWRRTKNGHVRKPLVCFAGTAAYSKTWMRMFVTGPCRRATRVSTDCFSPPCGPPKSSAARCVRRARRTVATWNFSPTPPRRRPPDTGHVSDAVPKCRPTSRFGREPPPP